MTHRYTVFGLEIASELILPELREAAAPTADVVISRGTIARATRDAVAHFPDGSLLDVPGIAKFWVARGASIVVDAVAGVPEKNVRIFLLGSALALVIYQRGGLPLHANAVQIGGSAIAFMGASGSGKSTLAAVFADRRYPLLSDDVCVVRLDEDDRPWASPGIPRLRLWHDALRNSGRDARDFERSFSTADDYEKFDVPLPVDRLAETPTPLSVLYLLSGQAAGLEIERLQGQSAMQAIVANSYRGRYVQNTPGAVAYFRSCVALCRYVPVFAVRRPWDLARLAECSAEIETHAKREIAAAAP